MAEYTIDKFTYNSNTYKLKDSNLKSEVLNMFYPVGSYYETSDTAFNPNTAWGGTWILETAGQVHVSAGTGYSVSGAATNTSDGGADQIVYTPTGSTANVKLSDEQIAHGHTYTNPTVKTPTLTASKSTFIISASAVSSLNRSLGSAGTSGGDYNYLRVAHTGSTLDRQAPSIASGKTCTVSGGSVANLSGASSTRTTHTHAFTGTQAQLDNMQPYIVVNRWHRTA